MKHFRPWVKPFVSGLVAGSLLFSGSFALAANSKVVSVTLTNAAYSIKGKLFKPSKPSFIYKGTLYLPSEVIIKGLGESIVWNPKTATATVGTKPSVFTSLNSLNPSLSGSWYSKDNIVMEGKVYTNGIRIESIDGFGEFDLPAKYSRLQGTVGVEDADSDIATGLRYIIIYGDGKELYRSSKFNGGEKPINFDVSIAGVSTLKIVKAGGGSVVSFGDVKLIK